MAVSTYQDLVTQGISCFIIIFISLIPPSRGDFRIREVKNLATMTSFFAFSMWNVAMRLSRLLRCSKIEPSIWSMLSTSLMSFSKEGVWERSLKSSRVLKVWEFSITERAVKCFALFFGLRRSHALQYTPYKRSRWGLAIDDVLPSLHEKSRPSSAQEGGGRF